MMREDWIEVELGEVCDIYSGTGFPKKYQGRKKGKYPFYKVGDISQNVQKGFRKLSLCDNYIEEEILSIIKGKILPKDCVVFAKIGEALKLNRRAITPCSCLVDNNVIGIKAKNNFTNTIFLFYFLLQIKLENYSRATTIPSVRKTDIEKIAFFLTSQPEQRAIVAKIEQLFSELDNGITNLKKAKEKLAIYRQAVLKKAFEGEFVEKNGKEELPEKWENVKVGSICEVVRGGSPRPAGDERFYNGSIPFLKVADLTRNCGVYLSTFKYTIKEAGLKKTRLVKSNTLLLSNSGATLGVPKICTFPTTFNDGIAAFLGLDEDLLLYHYYFWSSKTRELRNINQGAAQPNLNTEIIGSIHIPIGPKEDLLKTVHEIETRLSVCDNILTNIEEGLEKAEALRQSILKKAFEGRLLSKEELEACRREPDWEPAEKLLKRIKQERNEEV